MTPMAIKKAPGYTGRSRGGLTTKIYALIDADGLPIALKLTASQAHDGRSPADMFDTPGDGDVLLATAPTKVTR